MPEYKPIKRSGCKVCGGKGFIMADLGHAKWDKVRCPKCKEGDTKICSECGSELTKWDNEKKYKTCQSCRDSAWGLL